MDFIDLFKKAQQLKETLSKQQEELGKKIFEGESGGGVVTAKVNGRQEVISVKIDPSLMTMNDLAMLQDLVAAAVNAALAKAKKEGEGLFANMMPPGGLPE
ncbi:MAG: YbaB/EbfC family nucleoid-associated protein [Deltaproteobacteria bacterium]|nr:YbaB/EbfC family nucleoid-associated protein [Deltaproteobacteria bacterium]